MLYSIGKQLRGRTMKIMMLGLFGLVCLMAGFGCNWTRETSDGSKPMYGLALTMKCDRTFYEPGEPVQVTVQLKNNAVEPRLLEVTNEQQQYRFTALDAEGKPLTPTLYQKRMENPAAVTSAAPGKMLPPGEQLEYQFNLSLRFDFSKAGKYIVQCRREVALPDRDSGKNFFGNAISNRLTIEIRNPPNGGKPMEPLKIGDVAPDFQLLDQNGNTVTLSSFKGRKVMIYFYPKANTPGCTAQSCSVRDAQPDFRQLGVACLGISADQVAAQKKFADKYKLDFPLLADVDHAACDAYRVWDRKSLYGKLFFGIIRSAFLVDEQGKLIGVWYKISPADTVPKVKAALGK